MSGNAWIRTLDGKSEQNTRLMVCQSPGIRCQLIENCAGNQIFGSILFAVDIMNINHGGVDVCVTKNLLYLFHRSAVFQSQCCTGMTQTVSRQSGTVQIRLDQRVLADPADAPGCQALAGIPVGNGSKQWIPCLKGSPHAEILLETLPGFMTYCPFSLFPLPCTYKIRECPCICMSP